MKKTAIILSLIFSVNYVHGQDLETAIQKLIGKKSILEIRETIGALKTKYSENHVLDYIDAIIEKDGTLAVDKYQAFIKNHPSSSHIDQAKFRVAQFYFAKGLYRAASALLSQIHDSKNADQVKYLAIRTSIALDMREEAVDDIEEFINIYPESLYLPQLKAERKRLNPSAEKDDTSGDISNSGKSNNKYNRLFTIQIGAFLDKDNAIKQRDMIRRLGYNAGIVTKDNDDELFYLVWVDDFKTEDQASQFGKLFYNKHGIAYTVVRKGD